MGYFTKDSTDGAGTELRPLSQDAIAAALTQRGWNFGSDSDGDLGGVWDGHVFYFFRLGEGGEVLQIRGRWNREIGSDRLAEVLELLNGANADKIWPKGYARVEDEQLGIYAECSTDLEHGVTPAQLDQLLLCGVSTGLSLFERLDEAFPEAAEAARTAEEAREADAAREAGTGA